MPVLPASDWLIASVARNCWLPVKMQLVNAYCKFLCLGAIRPECPVHSGYKERPDLTCANRMSEAS